jgi:hypothetical protein
VIPSRPLYVRGVVQGTVFQFTQFLAIVRGVVQGTVFQFTQFLAIAESFYWITLIDTGSLPQIIHNVTTMD